MLQRITFSMAVLLLTLAAGCASQPAPWEHAEANVATAQLSNGSLPLGAGDALGVQLFDAASDNLMLTETADIRD
jgi:hypothetical protein